MLVRIEGSFIELDGRAGHGPEIRRRPGPITVSDFDLAIPAGTEACSPLLTAVHGRWDADAAESGARAEVFSFFARELSREGQANRLAIIYLVAIAREALLLNESDAWSLAHSVTVDLCQLSASHTAEMAALLWRQSRPRLPFKKNPVAYLRRSAEKNGRRLITEERQIVKKQPDPAAYIGLEDLALATPSAEIEQFETRRDVERAIESVDPELGRAIRNAADLGSWRALAARSGARHPGNFQRSIEAMHRNDIERLRERVSPYRSCPSKKFAAK